MSTVLVTGANRGIGLEFVRQYLSGGWRVLATCRTPASANELQALTFGAGDRLTLHALDVEHPANVDRLALELDGLPIDLLINNAGSSGVPTNSGRRASGAFGQSDWEQWLTMFRVNVMGPMKLAEALVTNLEAAHGTIATLSSQLGSMALNTSGGVYGYRATKAAVNAVMTSLSVDLKGRGIKVVTVHPGWVKTDMGGATAPVEPVDSVRGVMAVIAGLTEETSGRFFNFDGAPLPW